MTKQQKLVCCPQCSVSIRSDRLEKHQKKVHKVAKKERTSVSDRKFNISTAKQSLDEVSQLVAAYIKDNDVVLQDLDDAQVLATMAFETLLGYEPEESISLWFERKQRMAYVARSNHLWPTFKELIEPFSSLLIAHKKDTRMCVYEEAKHKGKENRETNKKSRANNVNFPSEKNDFSLSMSWYDCNSVDPMDASKYIGYYQREYGGSRFGSFPVHDDYGDESWADGNPWE